MEQLWYTEKLKSITTNKQSFYFSQKSNFCILFCETSTETSTFFFQKTNTKALTAMQLYNQQYSDQQKFKLFTEAMKMKTPI